VAAGVWCMTLLSCTASSSAQGTANRMSAPMLDELEPFVDSRDSSAAAAGRGAAREAASSRIAAAAGRAGASSIESSSIGLGAYIGCFNASSGWLTGAENATKVRSGLVSCHFLLVCWSRHISERLNHAA
jgi:hypothetical protein